MGNGYAVWRAGATRDALIQWANKMPGAESQTVDRTEGRRDHDGAPPTWQKAAGKRVSEMPQADVKAIRKATNVSQSDFSRLIGINLRTLQNWEQHRSRPTGPARALLKIVASNPKSAMKTLHA